ncbi:MAG: hypothetical protein Q4C70_11975 [Planctomycetia bacterium]|nr:hypothetical protein [Planctomycetia bacterium]
MKYRSVEGMYSCFPETVFLRKESFTHYVLGFLAETPSSVGASCNSRGCKPTEERCLPHTPTA